MESHTMVEPEQIQTAVSAAAEEWNFLDMLKYLGGILILYIPFLEKRANRQQREIDANKAANSILGTAFSEAQKRMVDSEDARTIVNQEIEPVQRAVDQLISRMGEHNDNVNRRMDKISDTVTDLAIQLGPTGPRNRRGADRE